MYQLNIGLHVGGSVKPVIDHRDIIAALTDANVQMVSAGVTTNETETTLVVAAEGFVNVSALYNISVQFKQDCIAVRFPDGGGQLVGPRAYLWEPFNAAYFTTIEELHHVAA